MPAQPFTVHVDPDELTLEAVSPESAPVTTESRRDRRKKTGRPGGDERLAARQRSEAEHSARAASVGQGRSYAFRRS